MKSLLRTHARRGWAVVVSGAAVALAVGAGVGSASASTSAAAKNEPISITLGYIGTQDIYTGPEGFADSKGLLQKWLKPYKITIASTAAFANGPLLTAALVGGSLQLGEIGDTPALVGESPASGSGDNTRVINQDEVNLQSVLISQTAITSVSQLAGKPVYRQPQSYMDRWVQAYLKSENLLSNVSLAPGLLNALIPEFNNGEIPDLVMPTSDLTLITAKYNELENSKNTPQWNGTGVEEVTAAALQQDPGLPAAWNVARDDAIKYATAHQAAYYAFQAKAEETTPADAKEFYPLSDDPLPAFTASGLGHLSATLEFLVGQGEAKKFSLAQWLTPVGGFS
jgi:sulfonate transport system substrate-binding protein